MKPTPESVPPPVPTPRRGELRPEPARPEPARPEPARPEPARSEPARSEPARPEPPRPAGARPIIGLTLAALLAALGTSVANVALPTLSTEFGVAPGAAQWVVLSYLLAMTATAVQVGRLGDRHGRRRTLLIGLGVFMLATLACALAPTFGWLLAARAVQGVGAAVLVALPLALARDLVAVERLGAIMGVLGTAAAVGTALGPAAGGLLLGAFGWPAMFVAILPLGFVALFLLLGAPVPAPLGGGAAASGTRDGAGAGTAATAGRAGGEVRSLLRAGPFSAALGMNLLVATVMMSTLIVGPFYLTTGLGLPVVTVGLAMAVGPAVAAVSGVLAGRVVDRIGAARSTRLGLSTMAVGMLALVLLPGALGLAGYLIALVVLTPGYQLFLAANSTAALAGMGPQHRGAASGLLSLSRNLGLIAGASAMGAIYAAVFGVVSRGGGVAAGAALAGATATFALSVVLVGAALGVAVVSGRRNAGAA
ncbi:MFS transporter [Leucobacter luti]|uniref:Putative MFS family arabinose efflux permease n=1 Tax=Leucobacter luti TaxID=340320 RepID=A0A4Q7TKH5_9MICO|nr:MFS transporter [Leucobacter luti]MBL3700174.1 MFS transporter [Leucobacter luti]RZT61105.1 putative MFS family arabinose efflux permease [Leucobacter luti]